MLGHLNERQLSDLNSSRVMIQKVLSLNHKASDLLSRACVSKQNRPESSVWEDNDIKPVGFSILCSTCGPRKQNNRITEKIVQSSPTLQIYIL